eukprot:6897829-Prymnesium_polylepis.1
MTQAERDAVCKAHHALCQQHGRNTIVNAMQIAQTNSLKDELADDLAEFSSFERMSTDVNDVIRGAYKELHAGQAYAKGKGREGEAWRKAGGADAPAPAVRARGRQPAGHRARRLGASLLEPPVGPQVSPGADGAGRQQHPGE